MDPYNYLNEKNAILLNCKNPQQYNDVYVKTLEKFYNKQNPAEEAKIEQHIPLDQDNPLLQALGEYVELDREEAEDESKQDLHTEALDDS